MSNVAAATFSLIGGQFQQGDGHTPTENFTTINQVISVDFSGSKVDTQDITSADNTDGVRRFKDQLFDPGDFTAQILWNPQDATHQQLQAAFLAKGSHNFKRINPSGLGTRSFTGIITALDIKQALDKAAEATVKIKLSGPYVDA
jgi:hypothetical protein